MTSRIAALIVRLAISVSVFFVLSTYVWLAQNAYDAREHAVGYERAVLYMAIIFGAGLSFDCLKTVVFLPQNNFVLFRKHLAAAVGSLVVIIFLGAASAFSLGRGYFAFGLFSFVGCLAWMWWAIDSSVKAIEAATE